MNKKGCNSNMKMCSWGLQKILCLNVFISVSVATSPVPHVNVTARSSVQFNVLLLKERKCHSFLSAAQTMNNCYFGENKRELK